MRKLTLIGAVMMFAVLNAAAQSKSVCSLLTASDVSAVGASGEGIPGEMPITNGPHKGATMKMCSWKMKDGGLSMSANPMPAGTSREAVEALLTQTYQMLTAKGWKREKKVFGSVSCNQFTPPANDKTAPADTSCLTVVKGMLINADALNLTPVPIEKVKSVVDAAAGKV